MIKFFLTKTENAFRPEKCYITDQTKDDIIKQVESQDNFCGWIDFESKDAKNISHTIVKETRGIDQNTFQPILQLLIECTDNKQQYVIDFLLELQQDLKFEFATMTKENFISRVLATI